MRATLDIDEDLLRYLNEQSHDTGISTGAIASDLMREAIGRRSTKRVRNGVPLFTRPEGPNVVVTMELVNEIRDEAMQIDEEILQALTELAHATGSTIDAVAN